MTSRHTRFIVLALIAIAVVSMPVFAQQELTPEERLALEERAYFDADAQMTVGLIYAEGRGVPQDYMVAYAMFSRAALGSTGDLQNRAIEARDNVAAELTTDQMSEAEVLMAIMTPVLLKLPDEYDHQAGTNLILLAIRLTSALKGNYQRSLGLFGTEMIDVDEITRQAYRSLFLTGYPPVLSCKLETVVDSNLTSAIGLDMTGQSPHDPSAKLPSHQSLIARRETALYGIGEALESRWRYNPSGNFPAEYSALPQHPANGAIQQSLSYALDIQQQLRDKGFDDPTLKGALGAAAASLSYDGLMADDSRAFLIRGLVSYEDALQATIKQQVEQRRRAGDKMFMAQLCQELVVRDLMSQYDSFTTPYIVEGDSTAALSALVELVKQDLGQFVQP